MTSSKPDRSAPRQAEQSLLRAGIGSIAALSLETAEVGDGAMLRVKGKRN